MAFIALVICCVDLTARSRLRRSRREGTRGSFCVMLLLRVARFQLRCRSLVRGSKLLSKFFQHGVNPHC